MPYIYIQWIEITLIPAQRKHIKIMLYKTECLPVHKADNLILVMVHMEAPWHKTQQNQALGGHTYTTSSLSSTHSLWRNLWTSGVDQLIYYKGINPNVPRGCWIKTLPYLQAWECERTRMQDEQTEGRQDVQTRSRPGIQGKKHPRTH